MGNQLILLYFCLLMPPPCHRHQWVGEPRVLHWFMPDPAEATGHEHEIGQAYQAACSQIRSRLEDFLR